MAPIPAGEFTMGSAAADAKADEKPPHKVKLDAFWMQTHEVTWDAYLMFMFVDQANERAKPDPDLFVAAARRLGVEATAAVVVGDSVWDLLAAQRAHALGVGLLSGGYGREELERAGAYRVYEDPADLLRHLDEVGVRTSE